MPLGGEGDVGFASAKSLLEMLLSVEVRIGNVCARLLACLATGL